MSAIGKMLLILGVVLALVGLALMFADRIPYIGRLPGDIYIKKDKFSFYFPLTTSIVISIVLSLLFYLFRK